MQEVIKRKSQAEFLSKKKCKPATKTPRRALSDTPKDHIEAPCNNLPIVIPTPVPPQPKTCQAFQSVDEAELVVVHPAEIADKPADKQVKVAPQSKRKKKKKKAILAHQWRKQQELLHLTLPNPQHKQNSSTFQFQIQEDIRSTPGFWEVKPRIPIPQKTQPPV